jgi:hypothetical protein
LDLLNDFIAQSSKLPVTSTESTNRPVTEPIFGGAPQPDPQFQQFSQVAAPLPQPVLPIMSSPVLQPMPQETQKFTCCNPVGSPPTDYAPANSCAKCHYFECDYIQAYGRNSPGYCSKFDFPANSGYACKSGFVLCGSVETDSEEMDSEEVVEAFTDPATALLDKLENKGEKSIAVTETTTPKTTELVEPSESTVPELVVSKPEPTGVIKQSELKEEAQKPLAFADKELYSEARDMAESRFKNPDSVMAREYTRQKYVSKYKAKHGSKPEAFG